MRSAGANTGLAAVSAETAHPLMHAAASIGFVWLAVLTGEDVGRSRLTVALDRRCRISAQVFVRQVTQPR